MKKQMTYDKAGVDVDLGNEVSKIMYNAARETWKNREGKFGEVISVDNSFSSLRGIRVGGLPDSTIYGEGFDGVGTKVELAERMNNHETVAYDLFAMVCDDAITNFAEPVIVGSILDASSLKNRKTEEPFLKQVREMAVGYINAAKEANVVVLNGEVAELSARVSGYGLFNYNWGASAGWFADENKYKKCEEFKAEDYIVALREPGFRSNGMSLVREILENEYGSEWHDKIWSDIHLGNEILKPSRIYTRAIVDMTGGFLNEPKANIKGLVHITGGGISEKLGRLLEHTDYGALISETFEPNKLMTYLQGLGNVSDNQAYKTWNMGQGFLVVTDQPDLVEQISRSHDIESKVIGQITKKKSNLKKGQLGIDIKSNGLFGNGRYLNF